MTYWIMTCKRTGETDSVYTCDKHSEQMDAPDEYLTIRATVHYADPEIECDFCSTEGEA
ncbi:MAG: hypothetical protein KAJ42_18880 [Gemmatimonadetes bacterium]|nr:hypothetical protein [Gemmatimonadota bacterium]